MICPVPVEVQEVAVAALEAAPAEEELAAALAAVRVPEAALAVRVPEDLELPIITRIITITITVPILVGDSVRAVITAVAVGDALAR